MKFLHCYQLKAAKLRLGGECEKRNIRINQNR